MNYCCEKFKIDITVPSTTAPNIRIVKFVSNSHFSGEKLYGFYITLGYVKFDIKLPKLAITYCPYCGTELRRFYFSDEFVNEFEGRDF
jgi:hypothetical protein